MKKFKYILMYQILLIILLFNVNAVTYNKNVFSDGSSAFNITSNTTKYIILPINNSIISTNLSIIGYEAYNGSTINSYKTSNYTCNGGWSTCSNINDSNYDTRAVIGAFTGGLISNITHNYTKYAKTLNNSLTFRYILAPRYLSTQTLNLYCKNISNSENILVYTKLRQGWQGAQLDITTTSLINESCYNDINDLFFTWVFIDDGVGAGESGFSFYESNMTTNLKDYPSTVILKVNNTIVFNHTGNLTGTNSSINLNLNSALENCYINSNICNITFSADDWGQLEVSSLDISYNYNLSILNSSFDLSTAYTNNTIYGQCNATNQNSNAMIYNFILYNGSNRVKNETIVDIQSPSSTHGTPYNTSDTAYWNTSHLWSDNYTSDSDYTTYAGNLQTDQPAEYVYLNYTFPYNYMNYTYNWSILGSLTFYEYNYGLSSWVLRNSSVDVSQTNYSYSRTSGISINTYGNGVLQLALKLNTGYVNKLYEQFLSWGLINVPDKSQQTVVNQSNLKKGEVWTLSCKAYDIVTGLNSTWYNSTPLTISNGVPYMNTPLITSFSYANTSIIGNSTYYDIDNDNGNVTFLWKKNGTLILTDISNINKTNNTFVTSTFGVGNYSHFDNITLDVIGWDGTVNSTLLTSTTLQINNSIPTTSNILINNVTDGLNCTYDYTDYDSDARTNQFFLWYDNELSLNNTNQVLGVGNYTTNNNMTCSVTAYDGYDNSTIQNSSVYLVGDVTIPTVSSYSLDATSGYTDETHTMSLNCSDDSSIASGYPKVQFLDPASNIVGNFSMTLSSGIYTKSYIFNSIGTYSNFTFFCKDGNSNSVTNYTSMTFASSTRPAPAGGGGGTTIIEFVDTSIPSMVTLKTKSQTSYYDLVIPPDTIRSLSADIVNLDTKQHTYTITCEGKHCDKVSFTKQGTIKSKEVLNFDIKINTAGLELGTDFSVKLILVVDNGDASTLELFVRVNKLGFVFEYFNKFISTYTILGILIPKMFIYIFFATLLSLIPSQIIKDKSKAGYTFLTFVLVFVFVSLII